MYAALGQAREGEAIGKPSVNSAYTLREIEGSVVYIRPEAEASLP